MSREERHEDTTDFEKRIEQFVEIKFHLKELNRTELESRRNHHLRLNAAYELVSATSSKPAQAVSLEKKIVDKFRAGRERLERLLSKLNKEFTKLPLKLKKAGDLK